MIEPTESESKAELDRFIEALVSIKSEIEAVVSGKVDKNDNVLKNAPHTAEKVCANNWQHSYSREKAAYPSMGLQRSGGPAPGGQITVFGGKEECGKKDQRL